MMKEIHNTCKGNVHLNYCQTAEQNRRIEYIFINSQWGSFSVPAAAYRAENEKKTRVNNVQDLENRIYIIYSYNLYIYSPVHE